MPTLNNYNIDARYTKGSMVQDRNGNFRRVTRAEADENSFFAAMFMYLIVLPVAAAILCWNALVIVCLWWWEAPIRRAWKPPMTRKLMGHPFALIGNSARNIGIA